MSEQTDAVHQNNSLEPSPNPRTKEGGIKSVKCIGVYDPSDCILRVSSNHRQDVLEPVSRAQVRERFRGIGKPEKFDEWCMVAVVAEEAAHFVQHAEGRLPSGRKYPVKVTDAGEMKIGDETGKKDQELYKTLREVVGITFEFMGYKGKPPAGLIITPEHITIDLGEDVSFEREEYYSAVADNTHVPQYDYEKEANQIQSRVLRWWCVSKEKLPFWYEISFGE